MRILHTSDWHLGHTLHEHSREYEHRAFIAWLLETLSAEQIDALVISGDIFDSANPSAQSQKIWYGFLASANRLLPELQIVVIGGNHDSAARLDAPVPLLESMKIHVTGGIPYLEEGGIDWNRMIVPLYNRKGLRSAWVAAVPFLRPADLPPASEDTEDSMIDGVRRRYAEAVEAAMERRSAGEALIVTGHCYLSGSVLSELSERKILGGNQHALPVDLFDDRITYVALGHLHLAQSAGGRENVRYSGSPIPLSVSEIRYCHQVCVLNLDNGRSESIQQIKIPRSVEFQRVPVTGALPVETLLKKLADLPDSTGNTDREIWPYLEVAPLLDKPRPSLREDILQALNGKAVRLVRIAPALEESSSLVSNPGASLDDINPEDVFSRCYRSRFTDDPPPEYMSAFNELLQQVEQGEAQI